MAEKDIAEKTFIALNDVFADIINVLIFKGEQVITIDSLEDIAPVSQYKTDDDRLHEQERDALKFWNNHSINLILLGIENQSQPDKDMPFRIISYDGASYHSQLLKQEEKIINGQIKLVPCKERYPVITIVLYFGSKTWNYPTNLIDSFVPEFSSNKVTETLKNYISDYRVNLFDIPRLTQKEVRLFKSDFRIVADYFVNSYNNENYEPDNTIITHVDEFLKLMKVLTGDNRYEELCTSFSESDRRGGISMCKVLDAREQRGLTKGLAKGDATRLISIVNNFIKKNGTPLDETLDILSVSLEEYEAAKVLLAE